MNEFSVYRYYDPDECVYKETVTRKEKPDDWWNPDTGKSRKFEPGVFSKWCDPDLEYRWLRQEEDARKSNNETFLRWKEAERLEAERKRLKAERKRLKEEETCRRSERLEARRQSELLKENLGGEDRTVEPVKMEKEKEKESKSASRTCTPEEKGALRLVLDKIKSKETKKGMQLSRGEIVRLIERMIRK